MKKTKKFDWPDYTRILIDSDHRWVLEEDAGEALNSARLENIQFKEQLAKLCKEISHIGHLRSCSYGLLDGPSGDYCSCNLHLRKRLILEARESLEKK